MISARRKVRVRPATSSEIEKAEADEFRSEGHREDDENETGANRGGSSEDEEPDRASGEELDDEKDGDSLNLDDAETNDGRSISAISDHEATPENVRQALNQADRVGEEEGGRGRPATTASTVGRRKPGNVVVPITSEQEQRMRIVELEKLRDMSGSVSSREAWSEPAASRRGSRSSLFAAPRSVSALVARQGSAGSTRSIITVEEAEADRRLDTASSVRFQELHVSDSKSRPRPETASDVSLDSSVTKTLTSGSSPSILSPPELKGEQQAYVPYYHAKQAIARVLADMRTMRESHVAIVTDIGDVYKVIEDQTQSQFNDFVLGLRKQYASKAVTFRRVIHLQQTEIGKKSDYYERVLQSLQAKNQGLMQENRELLKKSKEGFVKMEEQHKETVAKLIGELDKEKAAQKNEISRLADEHKAALADVEAERERSLAALSAEHAQVASNLKQEREAELEKEVGRISQQKEEAVEEEKLKLESAKKVHEDEVEELRREVRSLSRSPQPEKGEVAQPQPVLAASQEDREMVDALKAEKSLLEARCLALQSQLQAVVTVSSSDADLQKKTAEKVEIEETEKEELVQEKESLEEKMAEWEEQYREEHNGEEPSEEEKEEALSKTRDALTSILDQLETKAATLSALMMMKEGKVSDGVFDSPTAAVTTVEQGERISELESRILELEEMNAELKEGIGGGDGEKEGGEELEKEIERLNAEIKSRDEDLENMKFEMGSVREGKSGELESVEAKYEGKLKTLEGELEAKERTIEELRKIVTEMEEEKLSKMDVDAAEEIKKYIQRCTEAESLKDSKVAEFLKLQGKFVELDGKLEAQVRAFDQERKRCHELQESVKRAREEREEGLRDAKTKTEGKERKAAKEHGRVVKELERKIHALESQSGKAVKAPSAATGGKDTEKLQAELKSLKAKAQDDAAKLKMMEKELKLAGMGKGAGGAEEKKVIKKQEKELKELAKQLEYSKKNLEKKEAALAAAEEELKELRKEFKKTDEERKQLKAENDKLGVTAKEGLDYMDKAKELTKQVAHLEAEKKTLSENYNSERVLRKKYYNMIEDMKGKIRVYCRARPLSKTELQRGNHSVISSPDEYSITVETSRGVKEFQFDSIFSPEQNQETVYEDTSRLIQSAVDGYNVCIFAYGQTGSGKTYTMVGELSMDSSIRGVAPRAMGQLFEVMEQNSSKFTFTVSCYMVELYNDQLIDLFAESKKDAAKLDIKKDKKGMVFVQGSVIKPADSTQQLFDLFETGSRNRHVASTKMNSESSRSHLVFAVIVESTNLSNGQVLKGKLSLVDLAGSERAAKTGATAEQLREAQSINKSLSALGDVISALSSEQSFIPYRNNKLTMLMQDSLGGNAKTLMFVNISPADYNCDETVISLTYASRVKLITNDAQKNADNKEIARLKATIAKLKKGGEDLDEED